ncbi:hypothetical protein STCU_06343 [Strigomonas culicis]|uniref:Uncharacterized protein n=1 Tax=Strigomonas culicis TaxID=28005 RepID=S9VGB6_9TRYP|nr:hypothetical protein STCU_06343 [Strigomonas culicis]|eukprot:EPY26056.1 hypothetical protein STCU_06343 [Strigomonas culicis]
MPLLNGEGPFSMNRRSIKQVTTWSNTSSFSIGRKWSRLALWCMLLLCLVACAPLVEGTMTFAPANVQQASLYQTMQVTLQSNPLQNDVPITSGDRVKFVVDSGSSTTCTYDTSTTTTFSVTSTSVQGYTGTITAAVTSTNFAAGSQYIICYMSVQYLNSTVMRRSAAVQGADNLLVWPAVYSSYTMSPAALSGGQGPALLSLTETTQTSRTANRGIGGSYTIFMVPCSLGNCTSWDSLTTACATVGAASSSTSGLISLSSLQGTGTTTVSGNFTVPYAPDTTGYFVCVPYCYDTSCGTSSVAMSYTVVAATPANIVFSSANPGVYTRTPTSPQARELGYMYFTGTSLSTTDQVKVIRSTDTCTSSTASLLNNVEIGALTENGTTLMASFFAPSLITATITGRVCYWSATTALWSTAYLSASSQTADFTIAVMQPTAYSVSPSSPTVGMKLVVTFTGSGLDGTADTAFLTSATDSAACDVTSGTGVYACTMAGSTAPTCTVVVNPSSNEEMDLTVCYQRSGQLNYAQVTDTLLSLGARNPVFSISPYPFHAGQVATVTFTGTSLSSSDSIQIIPPDGVCGTSTALTDVTVLGSTEVTAGTTYQYTIVGQAAVCGMLCYYNQGTALWAAVRPQTTIAAISASCGADNMYVSPYLVRYAFTQLPSAATPTVAETVRLTFSAASGSTSYTSPVAMKLVQTADSCTVAPCSGLVACQQAQASTDYASAVSSSVAVLMVGTASTNYIVCALAATGSTYIPVLPSSATSSTSTGYGFTSGASQVAISAHTPSTWRVALATLTATFTGSAVNVSTDAVYAVASTTLYYYNATAALRVCPLATTVPTTMLTSTAVTDSSTNTAVMFSFTGANSRTSGDVTFFCYVWYGGSTAARASYAGTLTFSEAVPNSIAWDNKPSAGYRATDAVNATISTSASSLSPTADSVFFYQFRSSSYQTGTCYCDATACASGTKVQYTVQTLTSSTAVSGAVVYSNAYGFDNYDYDAVYVVCYTSSAASGTTYLDTITVGMADPTYYSVSGTLQVGVPFTVAAVRRCVTSDCPVLNASDSLIIILNSSQCADVTGLDDTTVTAVGSVTISSGGLQYTQRFVVDGEGYYRVCYKSYVRGSSQYSEMVYSASFVRQPITVAAANPSAFSVSPTSPSAWEFLIFSLTCSATLCSACTTLRIVPGTRASCWATVSGTYTSTNCLTTTSIQFPDQYVEAGTYTICYGAVSLTARRLPGSFTVLAANPSAYVPTPTASNLVIYTNQASNYSIAITGTGLSVSDSVFMMPESGYTCHDLRTDNVVGNGTIQSWLAPSTNPYALEITSSGATWVVSNAQKRFGAGMLYDSDLCPVSGGPCNMKLCYLRSGMSWAPVNISDGTVIQVAASNPANITFDRYPLVLNMYTMVTVAGAGLSTTDVVYLHADSCSGTAVTALIGGPYVDAAGSTYMAVLRFNATADAYVVCYWQGATATEIATIYLPGQSISTITILNNPLYYVYRSTNFTSLSYAITQYEEMIVSGSFST